MRRAGVPRSGLLPTPRCPPPEPPSPAQLRETASPPPRTDQKGWVSSCSPEPWLCCPMGDGPAPTRGEHRGGWAARSGSYRSASRAGMAGQTERHGEDSPPPPPREERGGACSPGRAVRAAGRAARTLQPRLHGHRAGTRRPPPPARAPRRPQLALPAPTSGADSGAPTQAGSGRGAVPWEELRTAARSSGTKLRGDGSRGGALAQESLEPPPASGAHPRLQPRSGLAAGAGLFPRLHRAAQEQRGPSATRGGSCQSRGPAAAPKGRPRRSPHAGPGVLPPAGAEQDCRPSCGLRGKQAGAATELRRPPRPAAPSWPLAPGPSQSSEGSAR